MAADERERRTMALCAAFRWWVLEARLQRMLEAAVTDDDGRDVVVPAVQARTGSSPPG